MAYADDVELLAEDREDMVEVMKRLERLLKQRGLGLNVEKTKILVFRKSRETRKDKMWHFEGKKIEKVKEISYLGFKLQ